MVEFNQQPLPLTLPEPLSVIRLISASPKQAYYLVEVLHITGAGYSISSAS
jgi:hypothetical protein